MTTYERFQFTRQRTKPIASISSLRHQLYYWKKIHWTCKWIILIEWRLLKKYVTCLHRDAVRKTDVHSFFFFFFFLALYLWDSETRLYYCSESILSSVRQDELRQEILTVNERFSVPNLGQKPQKKNQTRYSRTIPKTHFYRQLFIERYTRNCGFASKQPIKHPPPKNNETYHYWIGTALS